MVNLVPKTNIAAVAAAACGVSPYIRTHRWNEKFDFIDVRADSVLLATVWDQTTIIDAATSLRISRVRSRRRGCCSAYCCLLEEHFTTAAPTWPGDKIGAEHVYWCCCRHRFAAVSVAAVVVPQERFKDQVIGRVKVPVLDVANAGRIKRL